MAGVPAYITPLSYIRGSGSQYITTDFYLRSTDVVKSKWRFENSAGNVYGCFTSSGADDNFCLYAGSASNNAYIRYNGQVVRDFKAANGTIYNLEHGPDGFFANGDRVTSFNAATFECSAPMYIFMLPNSSSAKVTARCYGLTVFRGGEQACNFIPARNELTGEVGFYESVGGVFYENAGMGVFTAGPEVNFSVKTLLLKRRRALLGVARNTEIEPGSDGLLWVYLTTTADNESVTLFWVANGLGTLMEVDGVSVPRASTYTFPTAGKHLVKFTLNGSTLEQSFVNTTGNDREYYFPKNTPIIFGGKLYYGADPLVVKVAGTVTGAPVFSYNGAAKNGVVDIRDVSTFGSYGSNAIERLTVIGTFTSIPNWGLNASTRNGNAFKYVWIESPNLANIGQAFGYNMDALEWLVINVATPPTVSESTFFLLYTNTTFRLYVPYSADHSILNAYKTANIWSARASQMFELNPDGTIPE